MPTLFLDNFTGSGPLDGRVGSTGQPWFLTENSQFGGGFGSTMGGTCTSTGLYNAANFFLKASPDLVIPASGIYTAEMDFTINSYSTLIDVQLAMRVGTSNTELNIGYFNGDFVSTGGTVNAAGTDLGYTLPLGPHTLKVAANGTTLDFFLDGALVHSASDPALGGSNAGREYVAFKAKFKNPNRITRFEVTGEASSFWADFVKCVEE